jgi:hypothetical protein
MKYACEAFDRIFDMEINEFCVSNYIPGPSSRVVSEEMVKNIADASVKQLEVLVNAIESSQGKPLCESPKAVLMVVCCRLSEGITLSDQRSVISKIVGQQKMNSDHWSVQDCIEIARGFMRFKRENGPDAEKFDRSQECERRRKNFACSASRSTISEGALSDMYLPQRSCKF